MLMLLLTFFACAPNPKTYQPADEVVVSLSQNLFQKHISAIGGENRYLSHETATIKGTIRKLDSPQTYRFVTYREAPNKFRTELKSGNKILMERGFDGKKGWVKQGSSIEKIPSSEDQNIERTADFFFDLNYREWYTQIYEKNEEQYAGRPCHAVTLRNKYNDLETVYFDQESGLKIGLAKWKEGEEDKKYWYRYGHYIDMNGTQIPLSIEEYDGGVRKVTLIESIRWDEKDFPEIKHP